MGGGSLLRMPAAIVSTAAERFFDVFIGSPELNRLISIYPNFQTLMQRRRGAKIGEGALQFKVVAPFASPRLCVIKSLLPETLVLFGVLFYPLDPRYPRLVWTAESRFSGAMPTPNQLPMPPNLTPFHRLGMSDVAGWLDSA